MHRLSAALSLVFHLLALPIIFISQNHANYISSIAISTTICAVQGSGLSSSYQNRTVEVSGIVTADFDQTAQKGFYIQSENCDDNSSTSDGIFVYLGERLEVVTSGDLIRVTGMVQEYYGMTEILASPQDISVRSQGNPLPPAKELEPPFEKDAARSYFEAREGMRVALSNGNVVGPTDSDDRSWMVHSNLGISRVFYDDPQGIGEVICVDDGGLFEISPEVNVGDRVGDLSGILDFRLGTYCMQLTEPALVQSASQSIAENVSDSDLKILNIATFNLRDLFDTVDDPLTSDTVLTNAEYLRRLQKRALAISQDLNHPAVLAVQEAENQAVLQALVERPEIAVVYEVVLHEGPDMRGIDLGLLYRPDRVTLLEHQSYQGCTDLVDGFGPDGNGEPKDPQNLVTCDQNGDGILDGNRLFSRPPLVVHLLGRPVIEQAFNKLEVDVYDFWLVVSHLKSKVGDSSTVEYTLPRRLEQAQFIVNLVQTLSAAHPQAQLVVLGDFNDYPDSEPMQLLAGAGLFATSNLVSRSERYTYIYHGVSQTIDDILVAPRPDLMPVHSRMAHINADYSESWMSVNDTSKRSSDHDPVSIGFTPAFPAAFLPMISSE